MIAFIDSSILLRKLFAEPRSLDEWTEIQEAYASRLLPLEVGRVIDRCRLEQRITDTEVVALHREARRVLRSIEIVGLSEGVLVRAAQPMPTVLGTLDAIHLATALELSELGRIDLKMATHDVQLARAAAAMGLEVIGAGPL